MSDEVDEMSAASRGSQPVAWWVTLPGRDFPYLSHIQDRAIFCQKEEDGSEITPLYRKPTLTDAERTCLAYAIRKMDASEALHHVERRDG